MSRRTDLLEKLLQSEFLGKEKYEEQQYLLATAELILTDFINIACNGLTQKGAGSLVINLQNDSTTYMSGHDLEEDLRTAERMEDTEVLDFMKELLQRVNDNDWSKYVLITLISDAGTRTFAVEAGGSQESLRALHGELN